MNRLPFVMNMPLVDLGEFWIFFGFFLFSFQIVGSPAPVCGVPVPKRPLESSFWTAGLPNGCADGGSVVVLLLGWGTDMNILGMKIQTGLVVPATTLQEATEFARNYRVRRDAPLFRESTEVVQNQRLP